jgi:hypothetical protein
MILISFLCCIFPLTLDGSSMEDPAVSLWLNDDEGLIIMLLQLSRLDILQCLKLELKSDLESEIFFSDLLEGLMPIVVSLTFLIKSSLYSHLNSFS